MSSKLDGFVTVEVHKRSNGFFEVWKVEDGVNIGGVMATDAGEALNSLLGKLEANEAKTLSNLTFENCIVITDNGDGWYRARNVENGKVGRSVVRVGAVNALSSMLDYLGKNTDEAQVIAEAQRRKLMDEMVDDFLKEQRKQKSPDEQVLPIAFNKLGEYYEARLLLPAFRLRCYVGDSPTEALHGLIDWLAQSGFFKEKN